MPKYAVKVERKNVKNRMFILEFIANGKVHTAGALIFDGIFWHEDLMDFGK